MKAEHSFMLFCIFYCSSWFSFITKRSETILIVSFAQFIIINTNKTQQIKAFLIINFYFHHWIFIITKCIILTKKKTFFVFFFYKILSCLDVGWSWRLRFPDWMNYQQRTEIWDNHLRIREICLKKKLFCFLENAYLTIGSAKYLFFWKYF